MKSITQQINNFFLDNNNILCPYILFFHFSLEETTKGKKKGFNLPKTDLFSFKFFFIKYFFKIFSVCKCNFEIRVFVDK